MAKSTSTYRSTAPAAPRDRSVNSPNRRADRQRDRAQARQVRVERKRATGEKINSGESMDIGDELDLMYEEGITEGQRRGRKPRRPTAADVDRARAPRQQPAQRKPTWTGPSPTPPLAGSMDRANGQSLILVFGTLAALGAVLRDVYNAPSSSSTTPAVQTVAVVTASGTRAYQTVSTDKKSVTGKVVYPAHLRSLAGVFVVTTIALVLNEVNPTFGVAMEGILLLDIALSLWGHGGNTSVIDRVGGAVFNGGGTVAQPIPNAPVRPAPSQGTKV